MPSIPFHITVCNPLRLPSPSLERLQHMEIFKCAEMQTRNLVFYVSVWRIGECALSNPSFFLNCELVFQRNISLYFSDDNGYDDSDYNEQRNSSMKCCNAAQKCYLLTFIENESGSGGVIIGNFVEIRIVLRCSPTGRFTISRISRACREDFQHLLDLSVIGDVPILQISQLFEISCLPRDRQTERQTGMKV